MFFKLFMSSFRAELFGKYSFEGQETNWKVLNRAKDDTDEEWENLLRLLHILIPWLFVHFVLSETLRKLKYFKVHTL